MPRTAAHRARPARSLLVAAALLAGTLLGGTPARAQGARRAPDATMRTADPGLARLEAQFAELAKVTTGTVGVTVLHLESGRTVSLNRDVAFPMASTVKVPLAVQLLTRVDRGELSLDSLIAIRPEDLHPGSGTLTELFAQPGVVLSVRNLLELMLRISDNSATDVLLRTAGGGAAVTARVAELGVAGVRADRSTVRLIGDYVGVEGLASDDVTMVDFRRRSEGITDEGRRAALARFLADPRDTATPAGMARLLELIWRGQALSRERSALLLDVMYRCMTATRGSRGCSRPTCASRTRRARSPRPTGSGAGARSTTSGSSTCRPAAAPGDRRLRQGCRRRGQGGAGDRARGARRVRLLRARQPHAVGGVHAREPLSVPTTLAGSHVPDVPTPDLVPAAVAARFPDAERAALVALRRDLHQHPELAFAEHRTADALARALERASAGAVVSIARVAGTGVVARIRGRDPHAPVVAVRGDIDALPIAEATGLAYASVHAGVMHACGHDVHATWAVGAAWLLAREPAAGDVLVVLQPAEETGEGALAVLASGGARRGAGDLRRARRPALPGGAGGGAGRVRSPRRRTRSPSRSPAGGRTAHARTRRPIRSSPRRRSSGRCRPSSRGA
jgi:beta-lactamase class A